MERITDPREAAARSARARRAGARVGLVPTMGALHDGHKSLMDRALKENDWAVCSIFVNPLQFNNKEDLERYPRQLEADLEVLEGTGCHMVFTPTTEGVYAGVDPLTYDLGELDRTLEGPLRPGHFQGVVNVVERLFHYVRPDRAYFGEKDRQQLAVIQYVAEALRWPVGIVGCPTLRETDGLAMSSRNQRLAADQRRVAPVLHRALQAVVPHAFRGSPADARRAGSVVLGAEPGVRLEYLEIADPGTLQPIAEWGGRTEAVALIAAWVGPVRLIDNITLRR